MRRSSKSPDISSGLLHDLASRLKGSSWLGSQTSGSFVHTASTKPRSVSMGTCSPTPWMMRTACLPIALLQALRRKPATVSDRAGVMDADLCAHYTVAWGAGNGLCRIGCIRIGGDDRSACYLC